MTRAATLGQLVALVALLPIAAARGQAPQPAPDLKLVVYYKPSDPAGTFKSQVYDVRKGEYDAEKVGAWLALMAREFPRYTAYVRDVTLAREPGATPEEKLASVRSREMQAAFDRQAAQHVARPHMPQQSPDRQRAARDAARADLDRTLTLFRRANPDLGPGLGPLAHPVALPDLGRPIGAANFPGGMYAPPRYSSPIPYPYVRPHP